jgi:peptide deformylase
VSRREVIRYPDPRLRERCARVEDFGPELSAFVDDLLDTLRPTGGIGLSAPQLGDLRAVFVMDLSEDHSEPQVFVNPEILSRERDAWVEESCLSIPGVEGKVIRATRLRVRAQNEDGEWFEEDLEDMYAVCVQHEVDHLEGRLFIDRLPVVKRVFARRRALKAARRASPGTQAPGPGQDVDAVGSSTDSSSS